MKIFAKLGELVLKLFDITGMIILGIPKIPDKLRGIDTENLKDKIDTEKIRENVSKIKNDVKTRSNASNVSKPETEIFIVNTKEKINDHEIHEFGINNDFTSKEKEQTVFKLQLSSLGFLVAAILYLFNFISFLVFGILGVVLVSYILYVLFSKIKLMYEADFNAYRDFFLMYIAVSIILVLVGSNPNFVMSYSFEFLPSLSILIFAVIAVAAVFLIFRLKYRRDYTFGTVIETGKKTAYVQVDYDIRSNVKPDIYLVDNSFGADDGDKVKLHIEEKFMTRNGNKPVSIIETLK